MSEDKAKQSNKESVEQPKRGPQQKFKKRSGKTKPVQPEIIEE